MSFYSIILGDSQMKKKSQKAKQERIEDSELTEQSHINWFPGHMNKAIRQVKEKMKLVDLVLEVRDARVALTSGNKSLHEIIGQKKHLIVLNKTNLADPENIKLWKAWFKSKNINHVFINCLDKKSLKQALNEAKETMKEKWASFTKKGIRTPPLRMMIVGVPNTGKSTIINRLTRRNATQTGDRPGVTRGQEWIVLGKDMELLDTPGIMPPHIDSEEKGLWLCAINSIKDEIVGVEKVADYLVDFLLKNYPKMIAQKYEIDTTDLDSTGMILKVGDRLNLKKAKNEIDIGKTCGHILNDFRKGKLGRCSFEIPPEN